ncbi:MAG: hypothetical protein IPK64_14725 [bacterium]|nr:hypothetical protein [bacterium]
MYRDFEDLRDNCPFSLRADIAIDLLHDDPRHLAEVWPATADGGFRLALTDAVTRFWEDEVRQRAGGKLPDDAIAIEVMVDSYTDPDMGSSLYLELHAYCGTEGIGDLCWRVFDDDDLERRFGQAMGTRVCELMEAVAPGHGLRCLVEVDEIEEE